MAKSFVAKAYLVAALPFGYSAGVILSPVGEDGQSGRLSERIEAYPNGLSVFAS